MVAKLTKATVEKLAYTRPGQAAQYKVGDTIQKGFYVRVGRDSKTFIVQASVKGKLEHKTLAKFEDDDRVEHARNQAALFIAAWRTGAPLPVAQPTTPAPTVAAGEPTAPVAAQVSVVPGATLQQALDEYLSLPGSKGGRKIKRKESTAEGYREILKRHTPAEWWGQPIGALTSKMVDDRHTYIGENAGNATADQWARYLRAVYESYDRRNPALNLPKNPVKALNFFKPPPRRDVVTWAELPAWWVTVENLSPIRRDCWKMLLLTGLRSNACSQLKWSEIDLDNGTLTVPADRMKSGKEFTAPLSRYVVKLLKNRKERNAQDFGGSDQGFVFPTTGADGTVKPITDINEQGYDGKGNKIRLLPGAQVLRRTFNTVATEDVKIPEAHRLMLVDHAMPYAGVNGKHYFGRMGDDPIRESLERLTRRILEGAGQQYDDPAHAQSPKAA